MYKPHEILSTEILDSKEGIQYGQEVKISKNGAIDKVFFAKLIATVIPVMVEDSDRISRPGFMIKGSREHPPKAIIRSHRNGSLLTVPLRWSKRNNAWVLDTDGGITTVDLDTGLIQGSFNGVSGTVQSIKLPHKRGSIHMDIKAEIKDSRSIGTWAITTYNKPSQTRVEIPDPDGIQKGGQGPLTQPFTDKPTRDVYDPEKTSPHGTNGIEPIKWNR